MKRVTFIFVCLSFAILCQGRTITVDDDGPADFNNIQAAINDSNDGNVIIVAEGTYRENISFNGKKIKLISEEGPYGATIDGSWRGTVVSIGSDATVTGFRITNGEGGCSGGICCNGSNIEISGNLIEGNEGDPGEGGGIACYGGTNITINENIIRNNETVDGSGGGIYCSGSNVKIKNNFISENTASAGGGGGIEVHLFSDAEITGNIITKNRSVVGGGIHCNRSNATITHNMIFKNSGGGLCYGWDANVIALENTITENSAYYGGGILREENGTAIIKNCIIYGNTAELGNDIFDDYAYWYGGPDSIPSQLFYSLLSQPEYCEINGNICADPRFINPNPDLNTLDSLINNGDFDGAMTYLRECFSLQPNSPCIDAGDPDYFDPDGTRADIGAVYFDKRKLDLYRDDIINFRDYAIFANTWLTTGKGIPGDIYKDSKVDYKDLKILAENWLWHYED